MSRRSWTQWFLQKFRLPRAVKPRRKSLSRTMTFETLHERITPAVNAFFTLARVLTVNSDNQQYIDISRNAAGQILVNGGAGSQSRRNRHSANTAIQVFGNAGDDSISLNETTRCPERIYGGRARHLTGGWRPCSAKQATTRSSGESTCSSAEQATHFDRRVE
jgi:hypothetical protein